MTIQSINGCIGCGTCVQTSPTNVIRQDPKTGKAVIIKKESLLEATLAYIEELRDHHIPMLRAEDLHELRLAHETSNMIVNAEMKLKASLMRTESRCSHYRLDYPDMDTKNWQAWINNYKGHDGNMILEKQPFDSWPA